MKKIEKTKMNKFIVGMLISVMMFSFAGCEKSDIKSIETKLSEDEKTESQKTESNKAEDSQNEKIEKRYDSEFAQVELDYGVKLGVYVLDTETNQEITYNSEDRFAYCSTFKALISGAVLQQYSIDQLNEVIKYSQDDVLSYAPITKNNVENGMTIGELCSAAVRLSDNTAANLLFEQIGGPSGFKSALNLIGDEVTEPTRIEPDLNMLTPGDNSDTSTPKQLAIDLKQYTTGSILTDDKKKILIDWMSGNPTGDKLIRAGAPTEWIVADKSGAGAYGTRNDIAIVMPPNRKPIFVAILSSKDTQDAKYDDTPVAEASKIIFNHLAGKSNE